MKYNASKKPPFFVPLKQGKKSSDKCNADPSIFLIACNDQMPPKN